MDDLDDDDQPTKPAHIPEPPPQLAYTLKQVAELVGSSTWAVRTAIYDGELVAKRATRRRDWQGNPTGKLIILRADLDAWLDQLPPAHGEW